MPPPAKKHTHTGMLYPSRPELADNDSAFACAVPLYTHADFTIFSLSHMKNCLEIVDSFLLDLCDEDQNIEAITSIHRQRRLLSEGLVALIVAAGIISRADDSEDRRALAHSCSDNALRILINLTNNDADWCHAIVDNTVSLPTIIRLLVVSNRERTNSAVKLEDPRNSFVKDAGTLDRLCLALGLLTNLVQEYPETSNLLRETMFDCSCPGKRPCIPVCHCSHRLNAIECLVPVYVSQFKTEDDSKPESHFLRGHLAILFGLLMSQSFANQNLLLDKLPGTSRPDKLDRLITNASEFAAFYADLTRRLAHESHLRASSGVDGDEASSSSTRLDSSALRMSNGDIRCSTVATEVIVALESLRNALMD